MSLRLASIEKGIQGQPGYLSKTLLQNKKEKKKRAGDTGDGSVMFKAPHFSSSSSDMKTETKADRQTTCQPCNRDL